MSDAGRCRYAGMEAGLRRMQTAMFLDEPPPFEQILDGVRGFEEEFNRE
ncbi:MAG: hypothetical protein HYV06_01845 [Deltaproteobacteria bacterium]|nr:hypothetical protein [Deltaproteobacteria bacterium]